MLYLQPNRCCPGIKCTRSSGAHDVPPGEGYRVRTSTSTAMPTDSTVQIVAAGRHSAHRGMMVSFEDLYAQRASDTSKMEIVITAVVDQHLQKKKSKTSHRFNHICWHGSHHAGRLLDMNPYLKHTTANDILRVCHSVR